MGYSCEEQRHQNISLLDNRIKNRFKITSKAPIRRTKCRTNHNVYSTEFGSISLVVSHFSSNSCTLCFFLQAQVTRHGSPKQHPISTNIDLGQEPHIASQVTFWCLISRDSHDLCMTVKKPLTEIQYRCEESYKNLLLGIVEKEKIVLLWLIYLKSVIVSTNSHSHQIPLQTFLGCLCVWEIVIQRKRNVSCSNTWIT